MIKQNRGASTEEGLSILNLERLCQRYHCLPSDIMSQDEEIIQYFEYIAKLEGEKVQSEHKKHPKK